MYNSSIDLFSKIYLVWVKFFSHDVDILVSNFELYVDCSNHPSVLLFSSPVLIEGKTTGSEFTEGLHKTNYRIQDTKGSSAFCTVSFEVKGGLN